MTAHEKTATAPQQTTRLIRCSWRPSSAQVRGLHCLAPNKIHAYSHRRPGHRESPRSLPWPSPLARPRTAAAPPGTCPPPAYLRFQPAGHSRASATPHCAMPPSRIAASGPNRTESRRRAGSPRVAERRRCPRPLVRAAARRVVRCVRRAWGRAAAGMAVDGDRVGGMARSTAARGRAASCASALPVRLANPTPSLHILVAFNEHCCTLFHTLGCPGRFH